MNRPFRLGVDFHTWDGIFQGSRSHLFGLYREAIHQAPDLRFVFLLDGVDSLRKADPAFDAPNVELVRLRHAPAPWRLAVQLPWARWRYRLDLLHMQYRLPVVGASRCACTVHDVLFRTHPQYFTPAFARMARWTHAHATRHAALLFTVSQYTRQEIARLDGVPAERIAVTSNGVDLQRFHPAPGGEALVESLGLQPGGYILSVGRLEPRKNHLALIGAYARLGADAPPLVIVGQRDFSYEPVFQAIARHGLGARVRLLERVDDGQLPALLRHARLFAYPAFAEGFGMPVVEALASGVPVVTSNTTSLPEVAGGAAHLVDPKDDAALALAMATLLQDKAQCEARVAQGLLQARRYSWEDSARVLVQQVRFWRDRHTESASSAIASR